MKVRTKSTQYFIGIVLGILTICLFAFVQQRMMGRAITLFGFIVPGTIGGTVGAIISYFVQKNRALMLELIEQNNALEQLVKKRTEELTRKNKLLEKASNTDALTLVGNRRYFETKIREECSRLSRSESSLSIILCDVDGFKAFNDCYGHQAGDECLKVIANELDSAIGRSEDFMARYGGEEFVMVLPNTTAAQAATVAETARRKIENLQIENKNVDSKIITASFGVAMLTSKDTQEKRDESHLIEEADKNLYRSKSEGKNKVTA